MLDTSGQRCPLCGTALTGHERTGVAAAGRARPYRVTLRWVLTANAHRVGHAARLPAGPAPVRFAMVNLLLLGLAGGFAILPHSGWVVEQDFGRSSRLQPHSAGWRTLHASNVTANASPVRWLWWHPGMTVVGVAVNMVVIFGLGWLLYGIARGSVELALRRTYRGEGRFGAALCYATAYTPMLLVAALIYAAQVVPWITAVRGHVTWPAWVHLTPACLLASTAVLLTWFWLLRMANSVPRDTRGRVFFALGIWVPALGVGLIGGWLYAQRWVLPIIADVFGMSF